MAAIRRRIARTLGEVRFVALVSEYACAVAVYATPSPEAARLAVQFVGELTTDSVVSASTIVAIAFGGGERLSREVVDVLREASAYSVTENPRASPLARATSFLDKVERLIPEIRRIVGFS